MSYTKYKCKLCKSLLIKEFNYLVCNKCNYFAHALPIFEQIHFGKCRFIFNYQDNVLLLNNGFLGNQSFNKQLPFVKLTINNAKIYLDQLRKLNTFE
jgi:hypothetical protein